MPNKTIKATPTIEPIEVKEVIEPIKKEEVKKETKDNHKIIKSCSKDGYTINLYKKGKGYFLNTNEDSEYISIGEDVANVIINKGDKYNNLKGIYCK